MTKTRQVNRFRLLRCHITLTIITIIISSLVRTSLGEVGTSAQYLPPYLPTACYGADTMQFPTSNLFAAAGEGIWDNGASCGRQYEVRCISAAQPGTCVPGASVIVRILDYAASIVTAPTAFGTTMVLSSTAFRVIASSDANSISVEFQQV